MGRHSKEELDELWTKYKQTNDVALRNRLILNYSYLVRRVVNRLVNSRWSCMERDDLINYGIFGLIDAIEKFDPSKGVKFETYAYFRIRGAIIDQIRQHDWMPRGLRQKAKKIEHAMIQLEEKQGRVPTDEELAQHLSMSVDELQRTLGELYSLTLISLEEKIIESVTALEHSTDFHGNPEKIAEMNEIKKILADAIDELPEKEKKIISLYYFDELTLKEIGMIIGVSESRVSQLHARALMKLKNKLSHLTNTI